MNLEQQLDFLAEDVQFANMPDFAAGIGSVLEPRVVRIDWRRRLLVAAAVIAFVLMAALAVPESRSTVASWLGLGGIRIEFVDKLLDRDDRVAIDSTLIVGDEIEVEDASLREGNPVLTLSEIDIERAYERVDGDSRTISLFYLPSESLPEIGDSGVGALLMQFETPSDFAIMIKKTAFPEDGTFTQVGEVDGYWVPSGNLIAVPYDPQGAFGLETVSRETGNVLLWQSNGITYRLETNLDRRSAIALAESLVSIEYKAGNQ